MEYAESDFIAGQANTFGVHGDFHGDTEKTTGTARSHLILLTPSLFLKCSNAELYW